jgi:hypothetical protein
MPASGLWDDSALTDGYGLIWSFFTNDRDPVRVFLWILRVNPWKKRECIESPRCQYQKPNYGDVEARVLLYQHKESP